MNRATSLPLRRRYPKPRERLSLARQHIHQLQIIQADPARPLELRIACRRLERELAEGVGVGYVLPQYPRPRYVAPIARRWPVRTYLPSRVIGLWGAV